MKIHPPVELPVVVSVRFSETDFSRIRRIALSGRHTVSQAVRLLLERALLDQHVA